MNRHQVLTGACNSGEQCYSVGSVEGIHFTAYAAGCNIVILASNFERVQIIPGVSHGNIKVSCIDCSTDTGKIAASYGRKVHIFEPTPLISESQHNDSKKLDYRWYRTATVETECFVNCLSWNMEGSKLLTGGDQIQIWQMHQPESGDGGGAGKKVQFSVGPTGEEEDPIHSHLSHVIHPHQHPHTEPHITIWESVWKCKPPSSVYHLKFSPDGFVFASAGKADRLVKIWYEDRKVTPQLIRSDSISPKLEIQHYSFVYISHPRAVTGFSWRKTSKFMPRGSVANMLVTSCLDNVCRIWCETILPDDGLIDLEQFDPSGQLDPKYHTHRHKKRFLQRLKTIRHAIHKRKKHPRYGPETVMSMSSLPSVTSVHDFHKFATNHNGVSPVLHFHLAGSINPETDIPLQPIIGCKGDVEHNFKIHWLNNKELEFTIEAEQILQELHKQVLYEESSKEEVVHSSHDLDSEEHEHEQEEHEHEEHEHADKDDVANVKKKRSKFFKRKMKHKNAQRDSKSLGSHTDSASSISSEEGTGSSTDISSSIVESLERKIELLLRDWHQSSDMLFSIHPVDGSFLVWLVDWLDECNPYCFRQAQVSFSSRLPNAFPIPDARTMASNVMMYCNYSKMDIKSAMKMSESKGSMMETEGFGRHNGQPATATGKNSPGQNDNMLIPNVLMISKHSNGSLNQWQISFSEKSKFQTIVSVAHASRACGHRFRTNTAACHPVLPLLLTTSHHNIPEEESPERETPPEDGDNNGGFSFCSELILWRVDPVGPLSKSGGIVELARINAPPVSAFANVAWVPTLLPSTTLGAHSNSPSALFVASDGKCLRLYQAVIDARTLLMDGQSNRRDQALSFSSTTSSSYHGDHGSPIHTPSEVFRIKSEQSSARPGCIMELEGINEAQQDWQNIQLLHVFQEQLVTGRFSPGEMTSPNMEAIVDLRNLNSFEENFYLTVLERNIVGGSTLHMWKITISSQAGTPPDANKNNVVPPFNEFDVSSSPPSRGMSFDEADAARQASVMTMSITTTKVCTYTLELPEDVQVVCANVAAGHLSSTSIYPACFAPYLLVTACSDGDVRFWKCDVNETTDHNVMSLLRENQSSITSYEYSLEEELVHRKPAVNTRLVSQPQEVEYSWGEWEMMNTANPESSINIAGKPITVTCAYSGRIAVAYRHGAIRAMSENPQDKFVNLYVAIYECESTGGSEWLLEDTIELKNIKIPDPKAEIDLAQIFNPDGSPKPNGSISPSSSYANLPRTKSVPSLSTIHTVRKSIAEQGNKLGLLMQKCLVQLDWVSAEDGSHILTVGVGSKVLMYSQVSNEVAQESLKAFTNKQSKTTSTTLAGRARPMMQKSKSLVVEDYQEEIRWMRLRALELTTADGLHPLPMHLSWVRAGILVIGMDNEMHVYSQWRGALGGDNQSITSDNFTSDKRTLTEVNVTNTSTGTSSKKSSTFKPSYSMPSFKHFNSNLSHTSLKRKELWKISEQTSGASKNSLSRSDSITSISVIHDYGLFEAARQANPVLPQYHPKQLMELLNFGKIKRVKAILAHLARCIAGSETMQAVYVDDLDNEDGLVSVRSVRPRSVSVSASNKESELRIEEDITVDVNEISSIPPLPIYALIAADEDNTGVNVEISKAGAAAASNTNPHPEDYSELFIRDPLDDPSLDEALLSTSADSSGGGTASRRTRMMSSSHTPINTNYFGPKQGKVLGAHLLHIRLPGLSSLDQMYLMALADTVASTKVDMADHFVQDQPKTGSADGQADVSHATESMDDCGVRFLLAMRHHIYLLGTLQPVQRFALQRQGLKSFQLVWAFHSESTEELLSFIPSMQKGEPTWEELRQFGAGWWINNISILKRVIEKVAKAAFQAKKDPLDAAIYFIAMKKKNVLWGLYRSVSDKKMMTFFKNDFSQERWRKAALKNAFALLGRQMFHQAAGFFLLAGSIKDAIEVCLEKLHDIQLAIVISRLYEGEDVMPESVKKIIHENILGCDATGTSCDKLKAHPDPFLRSMSWWLLKDYQRALQTLVEVNVGRPKLDHERYDLDASTVTPNVFNFYNYLRTHPLLLRQRLASASLRRRKTVMTGFTRADSVAVQDNNITTIDRVTPSERRLFFATAHAHFKNGCPLMALEVLSRLPPVVEDDEDRKMLLSSSKGSTPSVKCISTGTLSEMDEPDTSMAANDWSTPISGNLKTVSSGGFDSALTNGNDDSMDWGKPVSFSLDSDKSDNFDWGTPSYGVRFGDLDKELEMIGSSDPVEDENENIEPKSIFNNDQTENENKDYKNDTSVITETTHQKLDIMAQQYKFIACLKVLMEELGTLATGFEVDGGQLRYQLYIWLEKEAEVLRVLCNYGQQEEDLPDATNLDVSRDSDDFLDVPKFGRSLSMKSDTSASKASLHEVILADKMDLEAKMERMSRRKQWLKNNQQLLRTLLSYCMLQGSGGGGLASVRMELLLLLQELQQEKPQQQLLSPLPFPTTLPLLSASIASSKTVVADPINYLQCLSQDILHTIVELTVPPNLGTEISNVFLLRNLAVALSSCIYQCLCDSDSFVVSLGDEDVGLEGFSGPNFVCQASYLMAGVRKRRHRDNSYGEDAINTPPAKWPGVTSLRVLLAREKDEDAPKLHILLCESLLAVYISLLINGLSTYDPLMLYRLIAHSFDQQTWSALFGGGVKTVVKTTNNPPNHSSSDDSAKQRHRLNMKLMGPNQGYSKPTELRETYKERFLPPELSMVTYFMTKPFVASSESIISYDSEDSMLSDASEELDSDEDELDRPNTLNLPTVQQHSDPNSYTWCLMRYTIVHLVLNNLQNFLPQIGIEIPELPNCSPLLHAVMKTLEQWDEFLLSRLEMFSGPPDNYIPGLHLDIIGGIPHTKLQALLDPSNTPFVGGQATLPVKRLWFQLVKQDYLKEIFIRYIYRRKRNIGYSEVDSMRTSSTEPNDQILLMKAPEPMKVVHKEQDIITAFANNQANLNCITLATQKEIVELDIGPILHPPTWLEDETEYDIECIRNPNPPPADVPDFLVVQTPQDGPQLPHSGTQTPSTPYYPSTPGSMGVGTPQAQTGRGSTVKPLSKQVKGLNFPGMHNPSFSQFVLDRSKRLIRMILRRQVVGVRRMGSHPNLPHYLSGSADGSVRLWEWGHAQPLTVLRQQGCFPKVTKVLFNAQGNKCCVSDIEGSICLWQVGLGSNFNKPIMSLSCHNKTTSDFTFVGSSSLIATAGHSSESKNVCLWDTLLPQRSALVHAFTCHEHGSPAIVYAPQHQMLISGGRKGEICIFDMRQRMMRHTFQAHDGPIKCLAMDAEEEYFVTGSAEGDVKVWGLDIHQLLFSFPGEHSKNTFFKNVVSTSGVAQVALGPGHHLFSCGVDGSMKFRQLPEKDLVVQTWP